MSFGKLNQETGKKLTGFLGKQGFYLLMIACVGIIGITALVGGLAGRKNAEKLNNKPTPTVTVKPASNGAIIEDPEEEEPTGSNTIDKIVLMQPVTGEILRPYAMDSLVYSTTLKHWQTHSGIDIKAAEGTKVVAAYGGTVTSVAQDALMGTVVTIKHEDNSYTIYSSLKTAAVKKDDKVVAGETIGAVGTTASSEVIDGAHLHFEFKVGANFVNPVDYFSSNK